VSTDLEADLRSAFEAASQSVIPHADLANRVRRGARRRRRVAAGVTLAVVALAGASYVGAATSRSSGPGTHHGPAPFVVRLTAGQDVESLAASGPYLYVGTSHSALPPYTLSAYARASGQLIRRVSVPAVPTSLIAGPTRSVWLTFTPTEGGGPCGTWLLTADLARRSYAQLLCNYALLPTSADTAMTVVGTNGHLGTVVMPPPGQPGRPHVTRTAYVGKYAVASLAQVGNHVAAQVTNDSGRPHVVISGERGVSYGSPGQWVEYMAAQGDSLWVVTYSGLAASSGPLVRLTARLRPNTPRALEADPILRRSVQVWTHKTTVWVATASTAHRLVCFAGHNRTGRLATIPVPGPPVALAATDRIVYVAIGSGMTGATGVRPAGVLAYRIPATCT
jgi:hypothetical protein